MHEGSVLKGLCWTLAFVLGVMLVGALVSAAQEKPARPMRTWQLGWIPPNDDAHETYHKVTVFDTESVCLYVVTGIRKEVEFNSKDDALAISQSAAIAAVSKKDLLHGAGCQ